MTISYYTQVIVYLLILSVILWFFLKFSKKLRHKTFTGDIIIKDRQPISSQSTLLVVKIREQELLIGVTHQNISVLKEL